MKNGNKQPFSSDIPYAFGLSNLGCMDVFGLLKVEKQSTALHGLALTPGRLPNWKNYAFY